MPTQNSRVKLLGVEDRFEKKKISKIGLMIVFIGTDLKMENVMLNSIQNQIKIVDFGLSNEWTADNPLKTHCGSPEYAAPELFVTSKVYGPEVDLWSLGIILYGMVVGQLPFVSAKSPSITSQERRKLLVAQINKGISSPQRKALACFSFEFRNLMSRLLSADSKKRMTIREMIVHPWITENGRRFVRTNPTRKITAIAHNKILSDISSISNSQPGEIHRRIKEDPFGKAGGMYNILVHRATIKPFSPDLVTRCLSDTITFHLGCKKEKEKLEVAHRLLQTAREENDRRIRLSRPHTVSNPTSDMSKTKTILTSRVPHQLHLYHSAASKESTPKIAACGSARTTRPRSVQFVKTPEIREDTQRPVTSALHKRREYAASLATRISQQSTPKSAKSKKIEKDEYHFGILKRRLEYLHKVLPSHGQDTPSKQVTKVSDSNISRKSQRTPTTPRRKISADRSNNPKASTSTTKAQRNPSPTNLPPFHAFMQFITPHGDISKRGKVNINMEKGHAKGSQKSGVLRYSDKHNIEPRKSPASIKLKAKRPVSCHSNIESNTPIPRRTSVIPVSETQSAKPSAITCSMIRPGQHFLEAYRGLTELANKSRTCKNIHSIPPNRHSLAREPKPVSARGDSECRRNTSSPTSTSRRSLPPPKPPLPDNTKISKNILNYLQRSEFHR